MPLKCICLVGPMLPIFDDKDVYDTAGGRRTQLHTYMLSWAICNFGQKVIRVQSWPRVFCSWESKPESTTSKLVTGHLCMYSAA